MIVNCPKGRENSEGCEHWDDNKGCILKDNSIKDDLRN